MAEIKAGAPDPYDAVLADLRSQRDELDSTIRTLEALRDRRLGISPPVAAVPEQPAKVENPAGQFLGMSIVDATKALLKSRKQVLGNADILKELQAGGVVLTGADPLNVVGSVLTRRFNNVGDVVRVGRGQWGLKEWYPGRTFKAPAKGLVPEVYEIKDGRTRRIDLGVEAGVPNYDEILGSDQSEKAREA